VLLRVLTVVVPLGLVGALSPVMLTEQTLVLAGPGGRRAATAYAAGAAGVLVALGALLVAFGRRLSLPTEPHLDATLDLVLGGVLLALGAALWRRRRRDDAPRHPPRRRRPAVALGFGAFSMATNVTTLALLAPAAKEVGASDLGLAGRAVALGAFVVLAALPAWAPVALERLAPGPAVRGLTWFAGLIARRGRALSAVAILALGALLAVRGVVRLLGG
jgi:hypothetical protein